MERKVEPQHHAVAVCHELKPSLGYIMSTFLRGKKHLMQTQR